MKKTSIVILGASGFAKEVYSWLPPELHVEAFFSDTAESGQCLYGVPVVRSLRGLSGALFLVAVGGPQDRQLLWERARQSFLKPCPAVVHPSAVVGKACSIGAGSIICPQAVLTTGVELGDGVIVNLAATIGHDSKLYSFVTVSPGANISGNVTIGRGAYIGTNAAIRERLTIGCDSVVGMGAVVVRDVEKQTTVVGNPARLQSRKDVP